MAHDDCLSPYRLFMTDLPPSNDRFDAEIPASPVSHEAEAISEPRLPPWQPPRYRRRVWLPLGLFIATCLTTFWAGVCQGDPQILVIFAGPRAILEILEHGWRDGLIYMSAVMAILLAHELGHFWQAVRNHVPASFPLFIPMPITPLGTMGAVIAMQGASADRRQLFDIGLTGPLAGLALAIPIAWFGIANAVPIDNPQLIRDQVVFHNPLLMQAMIEMLHPNVPPDQVFQFDPLMRAAWVGMLVTGLNMLPVSQLDGGHVSYALFGVRSKQLAYGVVGAALLYMGWTQQLSWLVMLLLIMFIGIEHRPTANDYVPLGRARQFIGIVSLAIPLLCFHPSAISIGN